MVDRIDVPLELKDFEVQETELVDGVLEVSVRSVRRAACHHCGSLDVAIHAEARLDAWIEVMQRVELPEFINTWRTLAWWREQILSYFDDRVTNAFAEGITNKIKVLKRLSYGFRNAERYRYKVLLACGRRKLGHD
jgi:hypothetical protein